MPEIKQLIILPFDHRGSFLKKLFNIEGEPTPEETKRIIAYKDIIYEGFKIAVLDGQIPKSIAGILVDEQFGDRIIKDAREMGFVVCICAEKSGQDEFDFEFGDDFRNHIRKYIPDFVKVLVRYNPDGDIEMNERQIEKLKTLSDFCMEEGFKMMIEPLVVPTNRQLEIVGGNLETYDREMRPQLMELMIEEMQAGGIHPAIWKIEGLEEEREYRMLIDQIRSEDRDSGIIVLGRNADDEQVERWLESGAKVEGVIGFAVGRTVFWDPLIEFRDGKISAEQAAQDIANKFRHFYDFFELSKRVL